jgi:hypothetical protein
MPYKVQIVKQEMVTDASLVWQRVADSGNERDGGPVYAYVSCPVTILKETHIYMQVVDALDIELVVSAVNSPKKEVIS